MIVLFVANFYTHKNKTIFQDHACYLTTQYATDMVRDIFNDLTDITVHGCALSEIAAKTFTSFTLACFKMWGLCQTRFMFLVMLPKESVASEEEDAEDGRKRKRI